MDNEERCFGYMECRIAKLTFPTFFPPPSCKEERGTGEGDGRTDHSNINGGVGVERFTLPLELREGRHQGSNTRLHRDSILHLLHFDKLIVAVFYSEITKTSQKFKSAYSTYYILIN